MRTKSGRRMNYSPVRQMRQTSGTRIAQEDEIPQMEMQPAISGHNNSTAISHPSGRNANQLPHRVNDIINDSDDNLEEVYICSCCGVSKELAPGMKFMSTFKSLFYLFNFLVFVFGLANLGLGLWFRIDPKVYEIHKYIETQNFTIAGWMLLFCGFTACLMSLLGCAAAARQVAGLLTFYFALMIPLTIACVGALVLMTVYGLGGHLEHFIIKEIYEQIRRRAINTDFDSVQFLDFIQVKMRCCGAASFTDYANLGMSVPVTCYSIDKNYINAPGCGRSIRELFDLRAGLASGCTLGSIVAQLFTITLSALMFCSIYHYRANPRPATPLSQSRAASPVASAQSGNGSPADRHLESPWLLPQHRRPRSRTPIIV